MYSQQDLNQAQEVWKTIDTSVVLSNYKAADSSWLINSMREGTRRAHGLVDYATKKLKLIMISPMLMGKLAVNWMKSFMLEDGYSSIFDSQGLERLISNSLGWNKDTFKIPLFICVHNKGTNSVEYIPLDKESWSLEERQALLRASASIPFIFPEVRVNNNSYCDGGYGITFPGANNNECFDNVPIAPIHIARPDIENYIIIGLSPDEMTYRFSPKYEKIHIFPLVPVKKLGNTLDFTQEHVDELIENGYEDAKRWLDKLKKNDSQYSVSSQTWKKLKKANREILDSIIEMNQSFLNLCNEKYVAEMTALKKLQQINVKNCDPDKRRAGILEYGEWLKENSLPEMPDGCKNESFQEEFSSLKDDFDSLSKKAIGHEAKLNQVFNDILASTKSLEANSPDKEKEHKRLTNSIIEFLSVARDISNDNLALHHKESQQTLEFIRNICEFQAFSIMKSIQDLRNQGMILVQGIRMEDQINYISQNQNIMKARIDEICDIMPSFQEKTLDYQNVVLRSLPDDSSFIGRDDELRSLEELMQTSSRCIPLVHAPAGTGKSMFAVRYAHIHEQEFHVELLVKAAGMKSLEEAFCSIYDTGLLDDTPFNIETSLIGKKEEAKWRNVIRSLERGKGVLLILDNIDSGEFLSNEAIEQMLPKSSQSNWRIIATTRNNTIQFDDDDYVKPFELSGLSAKDSFKLLTRKYLPSNADEEKAARDIVDFLDGNAWALELLHEEIKQQGERYEDDYQQQLKRLLELKDKPLKSEETSVRRSQYGVIDSSELFRSTLNQLSEDQKTVLQYLSLADPDFLFADLIRKIQIFKKYKNYNQRQWDRIIRELLGRHLIFPSSQNASEKKYSKCVFRMHRLTYHSLHALLPDPDNKYGRTACEWATDFIRNGGIPLTSLDTISLGKAALKWLQSDYRMSVLPLIYSLTLEQDLGDWLRTYRLFSLRREICSWSASVIDEFPDKNSEKYLKYYASLNVFQGHIDLEDGHPEDARNHYQTALEIRHRLFSDKAPETALLHSHLGDAYTALNDRNSTIREFEQALAIHKKILGNNLKDQLLLGWIFYYYNHFIIAMLKLNEIRKAQELLHEITPYLTEIEEKHEQRGAALLAEHYAIKGDYHYKVKEIPQAIECYRKSLVIYKRIDNAKDSEVTQRLQTWIKQLETP